MKTQRRRRARGNEMLRVLAHADSLGEPSLSPSRPYAAHSRVPGRAQRAPEEPRGQGMRRELAYGLGAITLTAFGAFVWNAYGGQEAPRIMPATPSYKIAPAVATRTPDPAETSALNAVIEGETNAIDETVRARPGPETPLAAASLETAPGAQPRLGGQPLFVANGPYVAQVAALQSPDAVDQIWLRLSSRAPALFTDARLDVERADLGQRGIYYRVRVGYFADRENVGLFCDRIKQMGQDCIAVRR